MSAYTQPAINNEFGAILTIGVRANFDRMAMVMPMVPDGGSLTDANRCDDLTQAVEATVLPVLVDCMSSSANVSFVQAEGMMNGDQPARRDYGDTLFPGTLAAKTVPDSCAGLICYYQETADVIPGHRIRTAKTFVPGLPDSLWDGDTIDPSIATAYNALATILQNGFHGVIDAAVTWYRCLSAPDRNAVSQCPRVGGWQVRGYIGTQRRRMIPH
jgi:hypothetical protein